MAKLKSVEELFVGRRFDCEVIILCVRWYLRFKLSLRDLVEITLRANDDETSVPPEFMLGIPMGLV